VDISTLLVKRGRRMGKILTKSIVAILLLSMFLAVVPVIATKPAGLTDGIWIEPYPGGISLSTATATTGYEFSITLWAITSINCGAWSFRLAYNKNYLTFVNCSYTGPGGAKSAFFSAISTVPVSPSVASLNGTHNRVDFGESWAGVGPLRGPGQDSLAIIWFQVAQVPNKGETLTSEFDISSFDPVHSGTPKTYLIDASSNKYGIGVDLPYTFVWNPPPNPYLISAITRFYNRYSHWVGTTFVETITLHIDPAWYMTNATFRMSFNKNFLEILGVTLGGSWAGNSSYTIDNVNGRLDFVLYPVGSVGGNVLVASVTFNITAQGTYPTINTSTLSFSNVVIWDHTLSIGHGTDTTATITVEGYLAVALAHLEVIPQTTIVGPEFAIGELININVDMKHLHFAWKLVGIEFRLWYDASILQVTNVVEGPYFGGYAPYGTWFASWPTEDTTQVLVGDLILPNASGSFNPPYPGALPGQPGENGTLATITFKVLQQLNWPNDIVTPLKLMGIRGVDANGGVVPFDAPINGTVTIRGFAGVGRVIDVYGGAVNAGYGLNPWPAPYGGQGPNNPMDLVIPQSEICLFANVTYNYWPVQQKDVGIEVEGPYDHINGQYIPKQSHMILLKETDRTDENGMIHITFAMPWPCVDPESLLGVWKVTVACNVRDVVVTDTMMFYYDYMVHIFKVTNDKYYYAHGEDAQITIEYGSHAMQEYPALFVAMLKDELNVPFMNLQGVTVGGAQFCTFANGSITIPIHIEKWMFSGYADLYVNCYDKDPTDGGFAWCPQYYEYHAKYILPN
jgi:hypothetical protein